MHTQTFIGCFDISPYVQKWLLNLKFSFCIAFLLHFLSLHFNFSPSHTHCDTVTYTPTLLAHIRLLTCTSWSPLNTLIFLFTTTPPPALPCSPHLSLRCSVSLTQLDCCTNHKGYSHGSCTNLSVCQKGQIEQEKRETLTKWNIPQALWFLNFFFPFYHLYFRFHIY